MSVQPAGDPASRQRTARQRGRTRRRRAGPRFVPVHGCPGRGPKRDGRAGKKTRAQESAEKCPQRFRGHNPAPTSGQFGVPAPAKAAWRHGRPASRHRRYSRSQPRWRRRPRQFLHRPACQTIKPQWKAPEGCQILRAMACGVRRHRPRRREKARAPRCQFPHSPEWQPTVPVHARDRQ